MNHVFRPYLDKFVMVCLDDIWCAPRLPRNTGDIFAWCWSYLHKHRLGAKPKKCELGKIEMAVVATWRARQGWHCSNRRPFYLGVAPHILLQALWLTFSAVILTFMLSAESLGRIETWV